MSRSNVQGGLETFVLLPFNDFRAMDQRLKKAEEGVQAGVTPPSESRDISALDASVLNAKSKYKSKEIKKDMKKTYQASHMKKFLQRIRNTTESKEILDLDNIEGLVKSAANNSRKMLPNEEKFFKFLFTHDLGYLVKNRNKIDLYFEEKDRWYHI